VQVLPSLDAEKAVALLIPRGLLGALYGAWPLVAVMGIPFGQGLQEGDPSVFLPSLLAMALGVALRGGFWYHHRARNNICIIGEECIITADGDSVRIQLDNISRATWSYGFFFPTFDMINNYPDVELETMDGQRYRTELLLPRWSGQRAALTALGRRIPVESWTVKWLFWKKDQQWSPSLQPTAPR
jgi:hypothetical protein